MNTGLLKWSPLDIEFFNFVYRFSTQDQSLDDSQDSWSSLEVDTPPSPPSVRRPEVLSSDLLKRKIQTGVQARVNEFWKEKIGGYIMQGDYLALIMEEKDCITWKSYLWDVPQGVLKFAINAGINTLPTFDNLKRWGKRVNDRCPFCGNIQTLAHVLSNCNVALEQGRFTWRHNSVLSTIINIMRPHLAAGKQLFSDLSGFQAPHGGTIPPHILVTNLRPDLFIVDEVTKEAVLFELTCPWDANIIRSHNYKEEKYAPLVADLSRSFKTFHFSFEVSARGQVTKSNRARIKQLAFRCCSEPRKITKSLVTNVSKAALLSSYSLFSARKEPTWANPNPVIVR